MAEFDYILLFIIKLNTCKYNSIKKKQDIMWKNLLFKFKVYKKTNHLGDFHGI